MTGPRSPRPGDTRPGTPRREDDPPGGEVRGLSQGQLVLRRFLRHRGAVLGLSGLALVSLLAFSSIGFGPVPGWWKWDHAGLHDVANPGGRPTLSLPTWWGGTGLKVGDHPFGQDTLGRDIFARTMKGVQTSLVVMLVVGTISTAIGIVVGGVAGYYRGLVDQLLMRFTDLVITFPVIVIGAVLGKLVGAGGTLWLAVALGLITWTGMARLVRADFLSLRERDFVHAARVAGAGSLRIMRKHLLPNAMGVIIVNATLLMSAAVLLETALSYLGFGVRSPDVSLGTMIAQYQSAFGTRPWLFWWPGVFIVAIALSVNFVGDGLRDAFDPRQHRKAARRRLSATIASAVLGPGAARERS